MEDDVEPIARPELRGPVSCGHEVQALTISLVAAGPVVLASVQDEVTVACVDRAEHEGEAARRLVRLDETPAPHGPRSPGAPPIPAVAGAERPAFGMVFSAAARTAPALEGRGRARGEVATESPEAALADLDRAIELGADGERVHRCRAQTPWEAGDSAGALAEAETAVELGPDEPFAHAVLGNILDQLGRADETLVEYDRAIELDPEFAFAYHNRGVARSGAGDDEGALADYDRAIELDPEYAEAYATRGMDLMWPGDCEAALADAEKAIELKPTAPVAYQVRVMCRADAGDIDGRTRMPRRRSSSVAGTTSRTGSADSSTRRWAIASAPSSTSSEPSRSHPAGKVSMRFGRSPRTTASRWSSGVAAPGSAPGAPLSREDGTRTGRPGAVRLLSAQPTLRIVPPSE